jgi:hypothetical protein
MGQPEPRGGSPFKRFQSLTRRLVRVPKAEIQATDQKRKAKATTTRPKRTDVRKTP